jgi:hypothetical protein
MNTTSCNINPFTESESLCEEMASMPRESTIDSSDVSVSIRIKAYSLCRIRAYRDKLKEWGYLRRQVRQQGLPPQLPTSGAVGTQPDAALPSMQSTAGIFGGLPDFTYVLKSMQALNQRIIQLLTLSGLLSASFPIHCLRRRRTKDYGKTHRCMGVFP